MWPMTQSASRCFGALLLLTLPLVSCRVSVQATTGNTAQTRPAPPPPPPPAPGAQRSQVSFRWSSRAKFVTHFNWSKPVCENVGPPAQPRPFKGVVRANARVAIAGAATGKPMARGKKRRVAAAAAPTAPQPPPGEIIHGSGEPLPAPQPQGEIIHGSGEPLPAPQPPVIPQGTAPTEQELTQPIPPPEKPPENVFGYEKPVRGCFEGQVYFIVPESKRLPVDYSNMTASTVLYACEWDIPVRAWEQGFPGLKDRFEWFAIRYTGTFDVGQAGNHSFRISSDDGARLTIDGKVVVDNDGVHPPVVKTGSIDLQAGAHEMVLEYFQGPRYHINLQLYITPPGGSEGLFSVR